MKRSTALALLGLLLCSSAALAVRAQEQEQEIMGLNELVNHIIAMHYSGGGSSGISSSSSSGSPSAPAGARRLLEQHELSIQDFFSNMLGQNWTDAAPRHWALPSFNWDMLGTFEYSSNLQDFLDTANFTKPTSLEDLQNMKAQVQAAFCNNGTMDPSVKVHANCAGPTLTLAYLPKMCMLDYNQKALLCEPAKLVLRKTPGVCTHMHYSASTWSGSECKISKSVGFVKAAIKGGAAYSIPLKTISFDH